MFKLINGGLLPQRATKYSAGFDVFANDTVQVGAGETVRVKLGICINPAFAQAYNHEFMPVLPLEATHYLELHPRSSIRAKGLGGGVGIIELDYLEEIEMVIHNPITEEHVTWWVDTLLNMVGLKQRFNNDNTANYTIKKGDKIGQLILKRHEGWLFPTEYTKDEERTGGFGSTDNKIDEKNVNASKMMGIIK